MDGGKSGKLFTRVHIIDPPRLVNDHVYECHLQFIQLSN